jgi:hypothetical protein
LNSFQRIAGVYTDRVFTQLGLHFTKVKYRNMIIIPNPIVSHEGTAQSTEFRSDLSGSEAVDTYTVSFPADALLRQFEAAKATEQLMIEQRFGQGLYTEAERAAQLAIAAREYRLEYAIAAYREWQLSVDKGVTWKKLRTSGDPKREAVRWVVKLVSSGV